MRRTLTSLAALAVATVASGSLLIGGAGAASAATAPPWEPDPSSVGDLTFYNAAGHVITGGSTTASPIAAFIEGSKAVRAGDTKATLFGYLPVSGAKPTKWSGTELSASTSYPNSAAPAPLRTAGLPLVTGASGDESVAQLAAEYPTTTKAGYAHVYQLRLLTSGPQKGISTQYDSADILITGTSWTEVYPNAGKPTSVTLAVSKSSIVFGSSVTLTATVKPATATGSISFLDGSKVLKKVTVSKGKATLKTTAIKGGSQKLRASFAPGATSGLASSESTAHAIKVKAHSTAVTVKGSVAKGKTVTLAIKVSPAATGTASVLDGKKKIGTAKVKSGKASFVTSKLAAGTYKLTVTFTASTTADYATSTSKAVTVKVTD